MVFCIKSPENLWSWMVLRDCNGYGFVFMRVCLRTCAYICSRVLCFCATSATTREAGEQEAKAGGKRPFKAQTKEKGKTFEKTSGKGGAQKFLRKKQTDGKLPQKRKLPPGKRKQEEGEKHVSCVTWDTATVALSRWICFSDKNPSRNQVKRRYSSTVTHPLKIRTACPPRTWSQEAKVGWVQAKEEGAEAESAAEWPKGQLSSYNTGKTDLGDGAEVEHPFCCCIGKTVSPWLFGKQESRYHGHFCWARLKNLSSYEC